MGACQSKPDAPPPEKNVELEKDLLKDRMDALFTFKILLLGAGESGKSTIIKQMRLIHNKKPTKQELDTITDSLHQNVIDCLKSLLNACKTFKYEIDADDQKTAEAIVTYEENTRIPPPLAFAILKLFNSEPIRKAYARRSEYWILDSCVFYLNNLERFVEEGFEPNEEDQVMARIRTTGIVVTQLEQKIAQPKEDEPDTIRFQVVDVGGQRNERKKWIHCFDDVKAILFIVNLNAYDQVLFEDGTKNRLIESIELFKEITHKDIFKDTPIVLFLNKKDLFETMIKERDMAEIKDHEGKYLFSDYTGGRNVMPALEYITSKFKKQLPPTKSVDVQVVTGVFRRDIRCAFDDVKKSLIEMNKKKMEAMKKEIKLDTRVVEGKSTGCCACCSE